MKIQHGGNDDDDDDYCKSSLANHKLFKIIFEYRNGLERTTRPAHYWPNILPPIKLAVYKYSFELDVNHSDLQTLLPPS